jgi:hypothetical protein
LLKSKKGSLKMNITMQTKTFEELVLEAKTVQLDMTETMAYFSNLGVPLEVVIRMEKLWYQIFKIGDRIIHIGKVIILKLISFIEQNPNMMIGIVIGVGLGTLAGMIPLIGSFISPVVTAVFTVYSSLQGMRIDRGMRGEFVGNSVFQDVIYASKLFWTLFVDIFTVFTAV